MSEETIGKKKMPKELFEHLSQTLSNGICICEVDGLDDGDVPECEFNHHPCSKCWSLVLSAYVEVDE